MFKLFFAPVCRGEVAGEENLSSFLAFSFQRRALGQFSNCDLAEKKKKEKRKEGRKVLFMCICCQEASGPSALGAPW